MIETTKTFTCWEEILRSARTPIALVLLLTASPALSAPQFQKEPYREELREDAGIGSFVLTVEATGGTIRYTITGGDPDGVFNLDNSTGTITLAKALNYDSVRQYALTVQATDSSGTDTTTVTVKVRPRSIAELIGQTKPMTAVLFSMQERNSFEVVKNPTSTDSAVGLINQNQAGETAGILIAAEAPFAFPVVDKFCDGCVVPIGAWFGVNLTTGGGEDVSDVGLAAGFSFSFLSANRINRVRSGGGAGLSGSARLLLGALYGEVASLGPKNPTETLEVGDPYPVADSLPLNRNKQVSFTAGFGFRF